VVRFGLELRGQSRHGAVRIWLGRAWLGLTAQSIKSHLPHIAERFVVVTDPVRDENGRIIGARALELI
jgi:hypothetical protein